MYYILQIQASKEKWKSKLLEGLVQIHLQQYLVQVNRSLTSSYKVRFSEKNTEIRNLSFIDINQLLAICQSVPPFFKWVNQFF